MKIAGVQMDVRLAAVEENLQRLLAAIRESAAGGAKLVIFPECALTGYCFDSLEEARQLAQPVPGPATETIRRAAAEAGIYVVFGMLESAGESVFNAAVLEGPAGIIGSYRKVHLPWLGADRFATYGNKPFAVHDAGEIRLGMNICYDAAFTEASRALALAGADLIALPTNWPPGAECMAEYAVNARAMENAVYYAAVNRVGTERGFTFIGNSRICDPSGRTLASASSSEETILYADIDPARARNKRFVRLPEKHVIDRLADRRPEMYHLLIEPHQLPRPGRDDDS